MGRTFKSFFNTIQFRTVASGVIVLFLVGFGISLLALKSPEGCSPVRDLTKNLNLTDKASYHYKLTGPILFIALIMIIYSLKTFIRSPFNRAINPMRKDEYPECRGINEFRLQRGKIRKLMTIIEEQNEKISGLGSELHRAKEDAAAAGELKSQFLANMGHEIRTPLNGILGMADLVLDTEMNIEQQEYLTMIKSSGMRLLLVINDILDFSRIEAGKMSLETTTFSLRKRLLDTFNLMKVSAVKKKIGFSYQVEDDVPDMLTGDPNRLLQVIFNLLSNAIKFTDKGEVGISVKSDYENRGKNFVLLHGIVSDTGIGIPGEKQGQIFNAFTQADSSHSRQYGGTGIGLSISSGLVRLMGGKIWFHSIANKGSRFHFTARFRVEHDITREEPLPAPGKSPIPGPVTDENEYRILLVEDERINRMLAEKIMLKQGWNVTPARNGEEALIAWNTGGFNLIVMDIQMPVMDGFEATGAIRKAEKETGGHVPIIAMTAHAIKGDREKCLAAGMDDYLSKPIAPDKFISTLSRYLDT